MAKQKKAAKTAKAKKAAKPKKVAVKKVAPSTRSLKAVAESIPCVCIQRRGRWFCMKKVDNHLERCDGPFATKEECEEHVCLG